jgi:hypothetical protein
MTTPLAWTASDTATLIEALQVRAKANEFELELTGLVIDD